MEEVSVSTLVRVRVPAESFILEETLAELPDLRAEIQPAVQYSHGSETPVRLLWAECDDFETLEETIRSDDSLRNVGLVAAFEDRQEWLFRAEWEPAAASLPLLTATDAILLDARSQSTEWEVRMFFSDRQTLSQAFESCRDRGTDIRILRVQEATDISRSNGTDLTPKQYEALVVAYQLGYYEIPRRASGEKVAETLNISHQALSERLCRGYRNLIDTLLQREGPGSLSDPFGGRLHFDPE